VRRFFVVIVLAIAILFGVRAPIGGTIGGAAVGCATTASLDEASCRGCHAEIADRHALSAHARSADSPVFAALRDNASETTRAFCDRCHSPRHERGERGIGCLACHGVVGNQGTANARVIQGDEDTVQGPTGSTGLHAAHVTRREAFITSAELCGTCHEVAGGGAFVETPYTEWSRGPAHDGGLACPTCHMAREPGNPSSGFARGAIATDVPDRDIGDHAFGGAAAGLLDRTAKLTIARTGTHVTIALANGNAGHALPAGARFIRRLTLVASTADGATASWDLGDRMLRNGSETFDPEATRTFELDGTGAVSAKLIYRTYDDRLLDHLGLDPSLAEPRTIGSATLP
jgi:hypothetical protein